jgi:positive regulator of sigma E activity
MDSKKEVTHTGLIYEVGKRGIKVRIGIVAGCADCQIKGNCNMADQTEKELSIECDPSPFRVGQRVKVSLKSTLAKNALFMRYILPFFILITTMIISSAFLNDETTVAIVSISLLTLYYFIFFLFKNRFRTKVKYDVVPFNKIE